MANKFQVTLDFPTDAELNAKLDGFSLLNRFKASDRVTSAMGRVVLARAKELAPRSKAADTDRWSKTLKAARAGVPALWRSVAMVLRKRAYDAYVIVGPKWPDGNKAYFNVAFRKGSREKVLWGKRMGQAIPAIRNWLLQAADETKSQQIEAARNELVKFTKDAFGG